MVVVFILRRSAARRMTKERAGRRHFGSRTHANLFRRRRTQFISQSSWIMWVENVSIVSKGTSTEFPNQTNESGRSVTVAPQGRWTSIVEIDRAAVPPRASGRLTMCETEYNRQKQLSQHAWIINHYRFPGGEGRGGGRHLRGGWEVRLCRRKCALGIANFYSRRKRIIFSSVSWICLTWKRHKKRYELLYFLNKSRQFVLCGDSQTILPKKRGHTLTSTSAFLPQIVQARSNPCAYLLPTIKIRFLQTN